MKSGMRDYVREKIKEIGKADILVGIPCYNEENAIRKVVETVGEGLAKHYPGKKSVLIVSDGGSLDDTREVAKEARVPQKVEKIVTIYRGHPGKGTSFRVIFEAAEKLGVKACACFDSDLLSITDEWVKFLISPVIKGYDYVTPYYCRDKYDGTITNNICYPLTRALYGVRVRQPIGGDFGFSGKLAAFYAHQEVWETDIAKFGIDIWMTTTAINEGYKVCQAYMGAKEHESKDPARLGPMFVQVVCTLFSLMGKYEDRWKGIRESQPAEIFGSSSLQQKVISSGGPKPIPVSFSKLLRELRVGFKHFRSFWEEVLSSETFQELEKAVALDDESFNFPSSLWAKVVYDFAYTFNQWNYNRHKLIDIMAPLYYGRVASFVKETRELDNIKAEEIIESQAEEFERTKPYFLEKMEKWEEVKALKEV
jgi:glycosyltransferase involved in cell wall biosynthesis